MLGRLVETRLAASPQTGQAPSLRAEGSAQPVRASFLFPVRRNRSGRAWTSSAARPIPAAGRSRIEHGKHSGGDRGNRLQRLDPIFRRARGDSVVAFREQAVQVAGIKFTGLKIGVAEDALEKRNIGLDAGHEIFVERP